MNSDWVIAYEFIAFGGKFLLYCLIVMILGEWDHWKKGQWRWWCSLEERQKEAFDPLKCSYKISSLQDKSWWYIWSEMTQSTMNVQYTHVRHKANTLSKVVSSTLCHGVCLKMCRSFFHLMNLLPHESSVMWKQTF